MARPSWRTWVGLVVFLILGASPAAAAWRRAESPNFIVYGNSTEARLRERALMLEDLDRLLRLTTGITTPPAPNKLAVYLVSGNDDLRVVRDLGRSVGGFYSATEDGIAAFVDAGAMDGNEVLFHEYAHHFMLQYAPRAYPAWYGEGFAEYFATAQFRPNRIDYGQPSTNRGLWITQGIWLPMEQILFDPGRVRGDEQMALFYAQSWLTTHYFFSNGERQAAFRRFLAAMARGVDEREALRAETGLTPELLTRELRRYISSGRIAYRYLTREPAEAVPVTITALPDSTGDLILYEAALRIGVSQEVQASYLQRIRTRAARHGEDPYARRVLAHAELLFGDAATADRLLDGLLATAPRNAELMYLKGMRYLVAAENGEWESNAANARRWFARAHDADPNHFQTLFRYAQSMRDRPNFVSENTSNILLLAHDLAPQVGTITFAAARMLFERGQYREVERLLAPLAVSAHDSPQSQAIRQMLAEARSRAGQGANEAPPVPSENQVR